MFSKSTIKYIQSLQHKKFRDEYDCFVAEGPKVVPGLLQSGAFPVKGIYALQEWVEELDPAVLNSCQDKLEIIKDFELEKIASYTTANKVLAVFGKRKPADDIQVTGKITLVLDDIQDPGNLGTIIRTADWFGIENIVCSLNTVDMYNSKVVQGTMASLGNVNIIYRALPVWLEEHKTVPILAATLKGDLPEKYKNTKEAIVIIGNEGRGISEEILDLVTARITIPKIGDAESLNAAVAAGIILSKLVLG